MEKTGTKDRRNKTRSQLTKADRAAIKQEQEGFIAKIKAAEPNEHQVAIFEAAQSGAGRYVILAGPGSGKTFTSIKSSTSFSGKAIYFSYNKKIQMDTNNKLVAIDSKMVATTSHAFGLSCLIAYTGGQIKVDDKEEKYSTIIKSYMGQHWKEFAQSIQAQVEDDEDVDIEVLRLDASTWAKKLIAYAQVSLTDPTPAGLVCLIDDFELEDMSPRSLVWPFVCEMVAFAIEQGVQQFLGPEHLVTFDDMVYLPNVIPGVPVRQYDHVIVDEAQDTSRASLELMCKACHKESQFFAVGDPKQNIYRFAGAAEDSIGQIIERFQAQTLPLRICYRCGGEIVDVANQLCSEDEKLISAGLHEGSVSVVSPKLYISFLQPGDAVIGRTTRKLVEACLHTLQTGKKAKVLGKNIGDNIVAVVTRLEAKRIRRGVPVLQPDLSNFLDMLKEHKESEREMLLESRSEPEMAISELEDKCDTVEAFFQAYMSKCYDESLRVPGDPQCAFNRTAKDFKAYIYGLFSEDEQGDNKDFVLFMTAHRSKGGEWENVYIIGSSEFPHPKAKSDRQQKQEKNLMFVAVTRAINHLLFVGQPFDCLRIPGYEPAAEEDQEDEEEMVRTTTAVAIREDRESVYDEVGLEEYDPSVVETLFNDAVGMYEPLHHDEINSTVTVVAEAPEPETLEQGKFSRVLAIEVLCPVCNGTCIDPSSGAREITYDLIGHTVVCSSCKKSCIVPLNAFSLSLQGNDVIAREKPAGQTTKREKKGRTQKERKSKAGRKTKGESVRQPMQLSLAIKTINALNYMGVNKSELFEELLQQYEPFLEALAAVHVDNEEQDEEVFHHDEIEE